MTLAAQIRFVRAQRRLYADLKRPEAVQMATAILASLERVRKFTRSKI